MSELFYKNLIFTKLLLVLDCKKGNYNYIV